MLVSAKKTERLLNLVICLLDTRRFLTVQQIRENVPGYDADSEDAFRRMFERDKEELRELGVPLETGSNSGWDDEIGYRIARRDYRLPDITLEPDEAMALGLAARLWQSAPLAGAAGSALMKLRAAGVDTPAAPSGLEPRIGANEPAFEACLAGVRDGRVLRFDYRSAGRPLPEPREVEPWGVTSFRGRWYLVGHDRGRQDVRTFRLSRIAGPVSRTGQQVTVPRPDGFDLLAAVRRAAQDTPRTEATVRVRAGQCWELRRAASAVDVGEGWDVLTLAYGDPERFADRVAAYGPDAVVLAPEAARQAVVARLRQIAGSDEGLHP